MPVESVVRTVAGQPRNRTVEAIARFAVIAISGCVASVALYRLVADGLEAASGRLRRHVPALGTVVQLQKHDIFGQPISLSDALVIFPGPCTGCSLNAVDPRKLPYAKHRQIVLVYASVKEDLPRSLSTSRPRLRTVADSTLRHTDAWGAAWPGRWYVVREDRLVRYQTHQAEGYHE